MAFHDSCVLLSIVGLLALILLGSLGYSVTIAREYERVVIFRLGRFAGVRGPGFFLIIPAIDKRVLVDLRVIAVDLRRQRAVTRDNVSVEVDAVFYYRVNDPEKAILRIKDYTHATTLLAQSTLRDVLGQVDLDDLLTRREELGKRIQGILDDATEPWGIKVTTVAMQDVILPETMIRAIAKQAEAERERRARVIVADAEFQAAQRMRDAAELYAGNPNAMRLRELQTLTDISREKNMVIVTPASSNMGSPDNVIATAVGIAKGTTGGGTGR